MKNSSHRKAGRFPTVPASRVTPSTFLRWLWTGNVLAISLLVVLIGLMLHEDRAIYRERAVLTTRNLAQVLQHNIGALIAKTDVSLQTIAHEVDRQAARGGLDGRALDNILAQQKALLPELAFMRIADASGNIRYGLVGMPSPPIVVADRGYFIDARQNADAGLVIDGPMTSKITGRWVVVLSRRLNLPDGSFMGVVYAGIEIGHFQELFSSMDLGTGSAIALYTGDQRLVTRYPAIPESLAAIGTATVQPALQASGTANPAEDSCAASAEGHGECVASHFAISSYPLSIIVTLTDENYLAPWRAEVVRMAALSSLLILGLLLGSWTAYRLWHRQRLAAESLRESDERFRLMVESVRDYAVFMLDAGGRVATWNEGARRLTGYPTEEIVGRPLASLYPAGKENGEEAANVLRQAEAEPSCSSEGWRLRKDGGLFRANTVVTAVRDEAGRLRGFTVILQDVTDQRLAEQAARKANALLLEAVESVALGFTIYDPDDRLVICNEAYRDFYRTSRDMIVPGVRFEDLVRYGAERGQYPEAAGEMEAWVRERVRTHQSADGSPQEQRLDDGRHLLIVEYRTPSGHIVSNRLDITELHRHRHQLEQLVEARTAELRASMALLRESEERFRSAFEQAAVGLAHVSLTGAWLRVNEKLCAIVGYSRDELLGLNIRDVTYPGDLEACIEGAKKVYSGAQPSFSLEKRYRRKEGSFIWVNLRISLVRTAAGKPDYFMAVAEDIQRRKETELALAEERQANQKFQDSYQRQLEQQVAERTAELVAANRELQGFTYAASHDLKAPLGRINSFSALLERNYREHLEGDGLLFLDFIRRNATRMATLIDDLLAHAQIEQKILTPQPLDLEEAVRRALKEREEEIRQGGALIHVDLPPSTVLASAHGLAQVLRNLLENALKYSAQANPPVIEIGGQPEGGRYRLWVRDNG
ncbi:MAG: multi-sensor signal transduction histidine kinase, partial [Rhodocyclaceae bacterium]|nr:multi-sensor signal transduction histidine kinase [Rhodocyclaceae bacterium]